MIKRKSDGREMKVTFTLPADVGPVSVVGDFNGWDPHTHPLRKRSNGTRSVSVTLPTDATYRFRYLGAGGRFFDDPDPDGFEANGYGEHHSLLTT